MLTKQIHNSNHDAGGEHGGGERGGAGDAARVRELKAEYRDLFAQRQFALSEVRPPPILLLSLSLLLLLLCGLTDALDRSIDRSNWTCRYVPLYYYHCHCHCGLSELTDAIDGIGPAGTSPYIIIIIVVD